MSSVREKVTYENCCFDAPCTMIVTQYQAPNKIKTKIRGFTLQIHGFLHNQYRRLRSLF